MARTEGFVLETLGQLRLSGPAGELLAGRRKDLALLAYLARQSPRAVSREELAALLWGESDEQRARQSLRRALYDLRQALGDAIETSNGKVRVVPDAIQVDATLLEREVAAGRPFEVLGLWKGDFLSGAEDLGEEAFRAWLEQERESLRRVVRTGYTLATADARRRGDTTAELQAARSWAEWFPIDSDAHVAVVRALLANGATSEARSAHTAFQSRISAELGGPPPPEVQALDAEIGGALRNADARRPGSAALFTPDLIGRDSALAALAELWTNVRAHAAVALIEGEEGIGKSRLCSELARRVRAATKGAVVVEARACNGNGNGPASTVSRFVAALAEYPAIEDAPNRALVELSRVAPELKRRFPQLASPSDEPGDLAKALRSVLRAVASTRPALLIIDDFARADSESQQILLSLANASLPGIFLVFTVRPDQIVDTDLVRELGRLPNARRVKLSPLTESEIGTLIDSMLELSPNDRERIATRFAAESGGNPFYVLELASVLADSGMLTLSERGTWVLAYRFHTQPLPLPPSLRAAIRARLAQLSEAASAVLHAAAMMKAPIEARVIRDVSNVPAADFHEAIDELLAKRLLRLGSDRPGHYEFSHDLIRRIASEAAVTSRPEGEPTASMEVTRKRLRSRRVSVVAAVAAVAVLVFGFALVLRSARRLPAAEEEPRIIVAAFSNETGDRQFDQLGQLTADWLTRGIAQTGLVAVLPPAASVAAAGRPQTRLLPDDFPRLAINIRPSMMITGSIFRSGDSIRFESQITDVRNGKVVTAPGPIFAPVHNPIAGLESLRQKLIASLAAGLDVRVANAASVQSNTPSYEAYKTFSNGLDDFYARNTRAVPTFLASYSLDTTFTLPLLYAAITYDGMGAFGSSDSLVGRLRTRRHQLAPYDRYLHDVQAARLRGDRAAEYSAARAAARIAPGSFAAVFLAPRAALQLNRPGEAVALLSQIDRERSAAGGLPAYWNILAHSYHLLGRYEDQIAIAKELRRRIPAETRAFSYEARALAALGRIAELDAVLDQTLSLPSSPGYGPPGLGTFQAAADELRAHGKREHAARLLERGLRAYENAPPEIRQIPRFQHNVAYAMYELGRLAEARAIYERLVRTKAIPGADFRVITYYLAFVAASQGDTARVSEVLEMLKHGHQPYLKGLDAFFLARLAAIRGQKEQAMRLLHQSTSEGKPVDNTIHTLYEFDRLRGYAPFENWIAPKG